MIQSLRFNTSVAAMLLTLLGACASGPTSTATVIRSLHELPAGHPGFSNMLVISVAGDYQSRAALELGLITALSDQEGRTTAYHTVVGRSPQLDRTTLENAILSRRFDAILFIRESGQEQAVLSPNRPVGRAFDLFGYDYPELNGASSIEQAATITFVSELYSVAERRKIWSIDTLSFDKNTATDLIDEQITTIAEQITTDRLLIP